MKIAITGGKGGVGKSMVAVSLSVEAGKREKVMLVDADVECPNDHLLLSIKRKRCSIVYQTIPKWNFEKCIKCGKCALSCKQNAIAFVEGRYPAFVSDLCIGCKACMIACPVGAITESKKEIGTVFTGKNYGVNLVSGELKLGELASGEVVAELREHADRINERIKAELVIIDTPAGIGCPVIASLIGTDYIVAVTEPTPSALFDLKRVLYLANHFKINHGIVINKFNLERGFCSEIEEFAKRENIPIIGKIPYRKDFVRSTIEMKPISEVSPRYEKIFRNVINKIIEK
ncbi:MAG: ATP-binding protein [Minisyncoccales bacterium]|jgi:MinD superfamily P-loop ATPase